MGHFERRWGTDMFYSFYNPIEIPHSIKMPLEEIPELGENHIGCRVVSKKELDIALKKFNKGYSPSYNDLKDLLPEESMGIQMQAGWRLEDFAAELMLKCKVGLIDDSDNYESLMILMNQKQRPMSCALSLTFDVNE